ncbi:Phosphoinositide phospholipase C [Zostera marina]|uniref:Phosphoinositide phospholipase C n=1 Tax=Zostera marina TaxID=29655 RepID=A0A0K9PXC5_ZOSMR|nr:Phosphoinositide phospholipase C [Zostera marina]
MSGRESCGEVPEDVKEAFEAFSDDGVQMHADDLRRFLTDRQGSTEEDASGEAERVFQIFESKFLLEHFHQYLFDTELNPPIKSQVCEDDMSLPLSHYYIHTGHNSYLTGNQLNSDSSVDPIIGALQNGVRVIELDIWPNSTKDDVDVFHGMTLTSAVKFIDCLRAIKDNAFSDSSNTVVVTLEDHLTPDLQEKAAKMITETFGDLLFYPESETTTTTFPSPQFLMKRILISTKPPKEYLKSMVSLDKEVEGKSTDTLSDEKAWGKEVSDYKSELDNKDDDEDEDSDEDDQNIIQTPEYGQIIAIKAGKPKGGLKEALSIDPNNVRRLSLSEQQLLDASESYGTDIVRFTQKNILRIYPKGTRIGSSNYNPFIGWMHGAQMVAFNMQGYGRALWLMQGFFRANGGCGYVKKPDFLMNVGSDNSVFNPQEDPTVKKTLKVKVYNSDGWRSDFSKTHFETYSPPDFYTRVGISGVPADKVMKKTKTVGDCWTPVWNEEFSFPIKVPELAVVRIEVHEYDMAGTDDFGGQTCLPVSLLRPGIRSVPLFNFKGVKFESVKILMKFEFC